jgi:hypothetical protein
MTELAATVALECLGAEAAGRAAARCAFEALALRLGTGTLGTRLVRARSTVLISTMPVFTIAHWDHLTKNHHTAPATARAATKNRSSRIANLTILKTSQMTRTTISSPMSSGTVGMRRLCEFNRRETVFMLGVFRTLPAGHRVTGHRVTGQRDFPRFSIQHSAFNIQHSS